MTTVPQRPVDTAVLVPSAIYNKHLHGCDILPSAHSKMYDAPKEKRSTSPHIATTDAAHVPRSLHSEKGKRFKEKGCSSSLVAGESFATDSHHATTHLSATCSHGKGLLAGVKPDLDSKSSLSHGQLVSSVNMNRTSTDYVKPNTTHSQWHSINIQSEGSHSVHLPTTTSAQKSDTNVQSRPVLPETDAFYAPADYVDIGDCSEQCIHCGAAFWYTERVKDKNKTSRPVYHGCCAAGKVSLPHELEPPEYLKQLLRQRHFLENIRAYNQMFAMTSFGAKIDDSINNGHGPLRHFKNVEGDSALKVDVVNGLLHLLDTYNDLIRLFRSARDRCMSADIPDFKIRLYSLPGIRGYELPVSDSVGAIVFESGPSTSTDYDVIIEMKGGRPQRINKLHPCYMSLQFPLLFIYGEQGYHPSLKMRTSPGGGQLKRMSMNAYYSYQLHERPDQFDLLFRSGRLFQQYLVSVYCCIEQNRMDFLRANQKDIRREYLSGVYDALTRGDREGSDVGTRVILPSSFTGGPRYMYSHYLDALAICRVLGNPQFFITFTCNIKWPEIRRYLAPYADITPTDRADIISRVFHQKVRQFMKYLQKQKPFGTVTGVLYTIEFQKRGLPHCHTLLWLDTASKITHAED